MNLRLPARIFPALRGKCAQVQRGVTAAALAGAVAGGGVAYAVTRPAPAVTTIVLTAHHSRFTPDRVSVAPGAQVRFVVRNRDPIDHEFIVGPPAVHERHERGTEAKHGAVPGEVSVPAGAEAETTYTFGQVRIVQFACHLPGHFAYGMHGTVQVG